MCVAVGLMGVCTAAYCKGACLRCWLHWDPTTAYACHEALLTSNPGTFALWGIQSCVSGCTHSTVKLSCSASALHQYVQHALGRGLNGTARLHNSALRVASQKLWMLRTGLGKPGQCVRVWAWCLVSNQVLLAWQPCVHGFASAVHPQHCIAHWAMPEALLSGHAVHIA